NELHLRSHNTLSCVMHLGDRTAAAQHCSRAAECCAALFAEFVRSAFEYPLLPQFRQSTLQINPGVGISIGSGSVVHPDGGIVLEAPFKTRSRMQRDFPHR